MGDQLAYLTILMDYEDKGATFTKSREWTAPCLVGDNVWPIHAAFIEHLTLGAVILILDGHLYAIPKDKKLTPSDIQQILTAQWKGDKKS